MGVDQGSLNRWLFRMPCALVNANFEKISSTFSIVINVKKRFTQIKIPVAIYFDIRSNHLVKEPRGLLTLIIAAWRESGTKEIMNYRCMN